MLERAESIRCRLAGLELGENPAQQASRQAEEIRETFKKACQNLPSPQGADRNGEREEIIRAIKEVFNPPLAKKREQWDRWLMRRWWSNFY